MIRVASIVLMAMSGFASAWSEAQTIVISRSGSRSAAAAPAENFTGSVRIEALFESLDPSDASGGSVSFEPGARTAWHSHPRGQILIVTEGVGRVQRWGHTIDEIRSGDVVRIPPGVKHWHGASPHAAMTHIAITEQLEGTRVQWMEKVSDEQYNGAVSSAKQQMQSERDENQSAQRTSTNRQSGASRPSGDRQQQIAPGLAALTDDVLFGDVWKRPELSPRDRSR